MVLVGILRGITVQGLADPGGVDLGRVADRAVAIATHSDAGCFLLLQRHAGGDWGDLDGHDHRANEQALKAGARLLSAYDTPAGKAWIITEADRSSACVLLSSEY